jgi:hypothetical protein
MKSTLLNAVQNYENLNPFFIETENHIKLEINDHSSDSKRIINTLQLQR